MVTTTVMRRKNMVWVPGGDFLMGSDDFYPEERPVHTAHVGGFWMDAHPVTVAEFRRFVKATGHVTVAETAPDAVDFPDATADQLVPGSLVFTRPGSGSASTTSGRGGPGSPAPSGDIPRGPEARCTAESCTRSPTSRTPMRWPSPRGQARSFRPSPSGSSRRAEGSRARSTRGGTRSPARASDGQHLAGRLPGAQRPAGRLRAHVAGRERSRPTGTGWPT